MDEVKGMIFIHNYLFTHNFNKNRYKERHVRSFLLYQSTNLVKGGHYGKDRNQWQRSNN